MLARYGMTLVSKPGFGLKIEGDELQKERAMQTYFLKKSLLSLISPSGSSSIFLIYLLKPFDLLC